ncbi:hypothetical protein AMTRI_Chr01g129280 [Amborella trichopoda]
MILCFLNAAKIQKTMNLSQTMREMFETKTYISNKLTVGLFSVGRVEEAVELLNEINQNSCIKPTPIAYNTLLNGCSKEGRAFERFNLLQEMIDRKVDPDFISHPNLLHGLLKWNEIKMGLQIYDQTSRIEFEPCERTFNKLAQGLCRPSLWKEIPAIDVEKERLMEKALSILRAIIESGHPPKRMTYNPVIKVFCTMGRVDDANECDETYITQTSPTLCNCIEEGCVPYQQPAKILVKETEFCEISTN